MKILILELARLGDIYQTWPALRALRRAHPQAEIHVLTRPRFSASLEGLTAIDHIHQLPTKNLLEPLVQVNMDVKSSYDRLSSYIDMLKAHNFDWIVNFSFSPASSYLAHALSGAQTRVSGYTRTNDGFLSIPDDVSAYFYAQGGVGRPNRFHLIEIFGSMVQCDILPEDMRAPILPDFSGPLPKEFIALHVGASQANKALTPEVWSEIIKAFTALHPLPIVLIGAPGEKNLSDQLKAFASGTEFVDLVGETSIPELFQIIIKAKIMVGCDSAPMHIATLTQTPCLNISLSTVNFWETGPRAPGSLIARYPQVTDVKAETIAIALKRMLTGEKQDLGLIPVQAGTPSYWALSPAGADFDWQFVKAIYQGEHFPATTDKIFIQGLRRLNEVNAVMLENLAVMQKGADPKNITPVIEQAEEIIEAIGKLSPSLQVVIRWYQTEKIRIGPQDFKMILQRTIEIHELFQKLIDIYLRSEQFQEQELK